LGLIQFGGGRKGINSLQQQKRFKDGGSSVASKEGNEKGGGYLKGGGENHQTVNRKEGFRNFVKRTSAAPRRASDLVFGRVRMKQGRKGGRREEDGSVEGWLI